MSDYEIGTIKAIKNKYQGLPVKFIFSFNMCQKKIEYVRHTELSYNEIF